LEFGMVWEALHQEAKMEEQTLVVGLEAPPYLEEEPSPEAA